MPSDACRWRKAAEGGRKNVNDAKANITTGKRLIAEREQEY